MKGLFLSISYFALALLCASASENHFQELADEQLALGNIDRAFRTYGDAIRHDRPEENNFGLYLNAGDCAFRLNYKQIAFSYYCIAVQKGAPASDVIGHIQQTYCNGDVDCTGESINLIIARHPEASDSLSIAVADLLYQKSRFDKAATLFASHLCKSPNDIAAKAKLANSLLHSNNTDSAKVLYQEILDSDPDNEESLLFLGNYYYLVAKEYESKNDTAPQASERISKATEFYNKSAHYLAKAYSIRKSDVVRTKLTEIFSITKNKEKLALYK